MPPIGFFATPTGLSYVDLSGAPVNQFTFAAADGTFPGGGGTDTFNVTYVPAHGADSWVFVVGLAVVGAPASPYQLEISGNPPFNNSYMYYPAQNVASIYMPVFIKNTSISEVTFAMNNYGGAAGGVSYTLTFDLWGYYTS